MITGILMGDGFIDTSSKNPCLMIEMVSPNYLEYVANKFGVLGGAVNLLRTAEENAKSNINNTFADNPVPEDYSDSYSWSTVRHPGLKEFIKWYSSGDKVWPKDIELTPTVLKHWYCGDGSWNNTTHHNSIYISMSNEINEKEKINSLFKNVGLPEPSNYNIGERRDGSTDCTAQFTVDQSKELWQYMGEPLPDFEYKWPERYC